MQPEAGSQPDASVTEPDDIALHTAQRLAARWQFPRLRGFDNDTRDSIIVEVAEEVVKR